MRIALKDLGLARQMASEAGVTLPTTEVALDLFEGVRSEWPDITNPAGVVLALEGQNRTDGMSGNVKGGEKVCHCGGGIVYHRHDEKGLNWEPGGIRSGAGVRSSGVSQESTGSSDTWEAALCRLCLRR